MRELENVEKHVGAKQLNSVLGDDVELLFRAGAYTRPLLSST